MSKNGTVGMASMPNGAAGASEEVELNCDTLKSSERTVLDNALKNAVVEGNLKEVRQALVNGADVHSAADGEYTPVLRAASSGHFEILNLLLDHGALGDVSSSADALFCLMSSTNEDEQTLLKCLNLLLDRGANPLAVDLEGASALVHAVRNNQPQLALRLINAGTPINLPDEEGWTPIFHAVQKKNMKIFQLLLDCGAKINLMDRCGRTLKCIAADTNNREFVRRCKTELEPEFSLKEARQSSRSLLTASNYKLMLLEGPKVEDRLYGFQEDAVQFLRGIELNHVASIMSVKRLQLGQLLTWSEDDWTSAGIRLSYHIKKIRSSVQLYHEKEWGAGSFPDLSEVDAEGRLELFKVTQVLASFLRMSHIYSTTSLYMLKHATPQSSTPDVEKNLRQIVASLFVAKKNIRELVQMCESIEGESNCTPPDLILPKSNRLKKSRINYGTVLTLVSSLTLVYILRKPLISRLTIWIK